MEIKWGNICHSNLTDIHKFIQVEVKHRDIFYSFFGTRNGGEEMENTNTCAN